MENKCLVCGAIIPEGRQVCPNCEKGGKHEISKKLTDEQIEIETYLNSFEEGDNITVTCDLLNAMEQALDLIHRLQDENNQIKSNKFASWKLKFFNLKDELKKELAEHEEFTKKAKEEIERLTEELKYYRGELL